MSSTRAVLPKIERIVWIDAYHPTRCGWDEEDDIKSFTQDKGFEVQNVGFVLHEDDRYLTVSSMIAPSDDPRYSHIERIPIGTILSRKVLR